MWEPAPSVGNPSLTPSHTEKSSVETHNRKNGVVGHLPGRGRSPEETEDT